MDRIRAGEPEVWNELINRFEGRLLAFVESRLRDRAASEDVVQETFIGFLTSLPNYDVSRPLEGYLFSIAAHKLTDHLRREGRRPALPLAGNSSAGGEWDLPASARPASSIARSGERKQLESEALTDAIAGQMQRWKKQGDWEKIMLSPNCCSCAACRTKKSPSVWEFRNKPWQTTSSTSWPACAPK